MNLEPACAGRREAIAALVLGELKGAEAEVLRRHLAQCETCRTLHDSLAAEEQMIVSAFAAMRRRGRMLEDVIIAHPTASLTGGHPSHMAAVKWPLRRLGLLAAAAAVVLAVALAVSVLSERPGTATSDDPFVVRAEQGSVGSGAGRPVPSAGAERAAIDGLFAARDIEGLMAVLDDGTPAGKVAAANYLAVIGDDRALAVLQRLSESCNEPNNPFAAAAMQIQTRLAPEPEQPPVQGKPEPNAPTMMSAPGNVETIAYAGTVYNHAGEPIAAVEVRSWLRKSRQMEFEGWELVRATDDQGRFELGPLPLADPKDDLSRTLIFEHPQHAIGWFSPYWGDNRKADPSRLEIVLLEPTTFSGTVVDPNGVPIEGALVEAELQLRISPRYFYFSMTRLNGYAVRTDAAGTFSLEKIPAGSRLHLCVSKSGYTRYASREHIRGDTYPMRPGQDVRVELSPGLTLRGQVLLHGRPYEKAGLGVMAEGESGYGSFTLTDAQGRFEMTDLAPGRYTVAVEHQCMSEAGLFCRPIADVEVSSTAAPRTLELNVEEGVPVTVILTDAATGEPVRNEYVAVIQHTTVASGRTDEQGRCVFRLGAGQYTLRVQGWKEGKTAQFPKDFTVAADATELSVSMAISTRPVISGWLVDHGYKPLRGTVIIGSLDPVETNAHGVFTCPVPWRSPGDMEVGYAFDETGKLGRAFFWKQDGEPNYLEIVAEPLVSIVGRITDTQGASVSDVIPTLDVELGQGRARSARNSLWEVVVEQDGRFRFTGVPAGLPMRVFVERPGYQGRAKLPEPGPGRVIDVGDVVLNPLHGFAEGQTEWTGTLAGRVIDEANEPMIGLTVHVGIGTQNFEDTTDLRGRYALKGLPQGKRVSGSVYADGYGHTMFQSTVDGNDLEIQLFPQGWRLLNQPAPGLFVDQWVNAESVTLEQYRGKVVLLQIGVLLPNGRAELDRMHGLLNEYRSQGLEVIAIHQRLSVDWAGKVTEDGLRAFVAEHAITFPVAIDGAPDMVRDLMGGKVKGNGATYSLYDVKATPALYLIDRKGILRTSPKRDEVNAWIERLLAE